MNHVYRREPRARTAIPDFQLPVFLGQLGARAPQWPHALALSCALSAAVKFRLLPAESLALLENRTFLIEVQDTGTRASIVCRGGLFRPLFQTPTQPDLCFRAPLSAFLQLLARQEDPDTLFFKRTLAIEGDTELGLVVKNMLDAIDWPRWRALAIWRKGDAV